MLMGLYFTSSVILMRVNLPPRHRVTVSAVLGGMRCVCVWCAAVTLEREKFRLELLRNSKLSRRKQQSTLPGGFEGSVARLDELFWKTSRVHGCAHVRGSFD